MGSVARETIGIVLFDLDEVISPQARAVESSNSALTDSSSREGTTGESTSKQHAKMIQLLHASDVRAHTWVRERDCSSFDSNPEICKPGRFPPGNTRCECTVLGVDTFFLGNNTCTFPSQKLGPDSILYLVVHLHIHTHTHTTYPSLRFSRIAFSFRNLTVLASGCAV